MLQKNAGPLFTMAMAGLQPAQKPPVGSLGVSKTPCFSPWFASVHTECVRSPGLGDHNSDIYGFGGSALASQVRKPLNIRAQRLSGTLLYVPTTLCFLAHLSGDIWAASAFWPL